MVIFFWFFGFYIIVLLISQLGAGKEKFCALLPIFINIYLHFSWLRSQFLQSLTVAPL